MISSRGSPRFLRRCRRLFAACCSRRLALSCCRPAPARADRTSTNAHTDTNAGTAQPPATATTAAANTESSNSSGARQYRNNTQLGDALIQIDPETRSLIIVADENTHADIEKIIKNLDRPKPQVLIKVLFAQVTLDNNTDFGVEGGYAFNAASRSSRSCSPAPRRPSRASSPGATPRPARRPRRRIPPAERHAPSRRRPPPQTDSPPPATTALASGRPISGAPARRPARSSGSTRSNATATLYALQQKGKVSVLSRPSILARNNQEAVIVVGQEVPIPTSNQITEAGQTIHSVTYQDVGIILRVTPFITMNKTVEMIVSPEISSLSTQTVAISSNFNAPIINKTSAETVVVTPDATTVVIGGLMQKQTSSNVTKVPLLGDIPFVGNAFKRTTKSDNKDGAADFPDALHRRGHGQAGGIAAVDQINRTDLPQETFTPNDVHQYLDDNLQMNTPPKPDDNDQDHDAPDHGEDGEVMAGISRRAAGS